MSQISYALPWGHGTLLYTILLPISGVPFPLSISDSKARLIHLVAFYTSLLNSFVPLSSRIQFDNLGACLQQTHKSGWLPFANVDIYIGIDGTPLSFILPTTPPIPIRIPIGRNAIKVYIKEYPIRSPPSETALVSVFRVLDPVLFYVSLESVPVPMIIIIGIWGSRARKIGAAHQSLSYTLPGPVSFSLAILAIHFETGTTDMNILLTTHLPLHRQTSSRLALSASSAVKVPTIPVHTWPPEAHVEAPTAGPAILAGVSLKPGGHGSLRSPIPMFPEASVSFSPVIHVVSAVAIIYVSPTTSRQVDSKKIIAYSSVAHTALATSGTPTHDPQATEGSTVPMPSHGTVPSASPTCVGVPHDRHKTRLTKYHSGSTQAMPISMTLSLISTLANLSFPTTSGSIGESLVLVGLFQANKITTVPAPPGMALGAAYPI